jgi:xanthine dehydrogenase accessory factor
MAEAAALQAFLAAHPACALVEVAEAKGSTPREAGAWMLVAENATFGTIGGGQLEWMAIDEARRVLARAAGGAGPGLNVGAAPLSVRLTAATSPPAGGSGRAVPSAGLAPLSSPRRGERWIGEAETGRGSATFHADRPDHGMSVLDIPLGPDIGQCCGGRVKIAMRPVGKALAADLVKGVRAAEDARPDVLVFGGGHVGHALAAALALLPLRVTVVETRAEALDGLPPDVTARLTAVPEAAIREARPRSGFVILTHDHALDFVLATEALKRGDAAYVGMIGSRSKRATFRRWFRDEAGGTEAEFAKLVCPIGSSALRDKRPAVIAALAAAEIVQHLLYGSYAVLCKQHKTA